MIRNRLLRKLFLVALAAAAVVAVSRFVVLRGLIRPVRVSSGSMAETLVGRHYHMVCDDCGLPFPCDHDQPPRGMTAVCPNCGFGAIRLRADRLQVGQRVLIDQLATLSRLRRWEVVAYQDPYVSGQITVKRLVGLPGEQLAIRDGDVYIDGQLARKDLAEQRRMAVLVHDNDFRPQQEATLPARWQADAADSRWRPLGGGFSFAGDLREKEPASAFDWLTYRHWRCVLTPLPRTEEAPIRDNYGYNQGVARQLHVVRDLMLVCRLKLTGDGEFVVRCDNGMETLQATIQPAAGRLVVSQDGREIADANWPAEFNSAPVQLVFSNIDRQAIVAAGDCVLLSRPLLTSEQAPDRPLTPTSRPFALGARNVHVSVEHLRIYRDLYYLDSRGLDVPWEVKRALADDEVFVLGDNVPISRDSRAYSRPLKRAAVLGRITRYD